MGYEEKLEMRSLMLEKAEKKRQHELLVKQAANGKDTSVPDQHQHRMGTFDNPNKKTPYKPRSCSSRTQRSAKGYYDDIAVDYREESKEDEQDLNVAEWNIAPYVDPIVKQM